MFNEQLHRRLDGEEESELRITVLKSFYEELRQVIEGKALEEAEGIRYILAAGVDAIKGWESTDKNLDQMTREEFVRFLQDRASSVEAAYGMMKFQAYQVMNQNDALEMNMRGLMPQLEAANQRTKDLEEEVRRLRHLVPQEQVQGNVLVLDPQERNDEVKSISDRLRDLFH